MSVLTSLIQQCQGVAAGYRFAVQQAGGEPYEKGQYVARKWDCLDCKFWDQFVAVGVRCRRN